MLLMAVFTHLNSHHTDQVSHSGSLFPACSCNSILAEKFYILHLPNLVLPGCSITYGVNKLYYIYVITEYLLSNETPTFQPGNFQNVYFITEYYFYPLFLMSKSFVYDHTSYLSVYLVFCSYHNQNILCKLFVMVKSLTCKYGLCLWMNKHTYWM